MKFAILATLLMAAACASAPGEERVTEFSPALPKNYLVVHTGVPQAFSSARCYQFATAEDKSSPLAASRLRHLLAARLPQIPECGDSWPRILIEYRAGRGVSLHHAEADPGESYSAFSFIALVESKAAVGPGTAAEPVALAEWQYWRGGSSALTMQQFVVDFTNLVVNGLVKRA